MGTGSEILLSGVEASPESPSNIPSIFERSSKRSSVLIASLTVLPSPGLSLRNFLGK